MIDTCLAGRVEPHEVATAAAYLLAPDTSFVVGADLFIDGIIAALRTSACTYSSLSPGEGISAKPHHLADAATALDVDLTEEEILALEEQYTVRHPTGY
jgi:hypothetical protein